MSAAARPLLPTSQQAAEPNGLLDIDKIRQLVDMMVGNDLTEITLRDGDLEVKLRRPNSNPGEVSTSVAVPPHPAQPAGHPSRPGAGSAGETLESDSDVDLVEIRSPMVGTFYAAPDPDSAPFVHAGSEVSPGTVVCVLEAMKVFSEIKAEVAGTIERILVKNAEAVEYGQPLFLVKPA